MRMIKKRKEEKNATDRVARNGHEDERSEQRQWEDSEQRGLKENNQS